MLMAHISWHFTKFYRILIFNAIAASISGIGSTFDSPQLWRWWKPAPTEPSQLSKWLNTAGLLMIQICLLQTCLVCWLVVVESNWALKSTRVMLNVTLGFKHYRSFQTSWKLQEILLSWNIYWTGTLVAKFLRNPLYIR